MEKIYYLTNRENGTFGIPSAHIYFNLFNWTVLSLDKSDYGKLVIGANKLIELTHDDILGYKLFSEPRLVTKVSGDDVDEFEYYNGSDKVELEVTEKRESLILKVMRDFANIIIEEEFDRRIEKLDLYSSKTENSTWSIQYESAIKYQTSGEATSFLSSLAESKGISAEEMANKIVSAKTKYDETICNYYVTISRIKKEMKDAADVNNINLLYNKYFGVACPYSMDFRKSRTDIFDAKGELKNPNHKPFNF